MFEQLIWYLKGYVRIRVTGYSPERFLNACRYKNIYIWDLKRVCGSYEMNLTIDGFRRLKEIVRKTGTKVCIIRRSGLPFLLHRYRKRHILLSGFLICAGLILFMTRFIWGIDISGNLSYTDDTLKRFLSSENVKGGMKKSDVNCRKIVQDLRKKYDRIIWVSASVDGCRLVIRIKENEDDFTDSSKISSDNNEEGKDIIADTDCTIVDIITRTGTPMVQRGTKVKKGAILVSGQIPICNDEKEITGYRLKNADADITGEKAITYQKELTRQYIRKKYYRSRFYFLQKRNYGIRLGRHYFTTESKNNQYPVFEKHVVQKKYPIANVIPVTLEKSTITPYRQMYKKYTKADARMILSADFQDYCKELEKKGVEIIQNDVKIYTGSETYYAKGTLKIRCSVGRKMPSVPIPIENSSEEETKNGD